MLLFLVTSTGRVRDKGEKATTARTLLTEKNKNEIDYLQ